MRNKITFLLVLLLSTGPLLANKIKAAVEHVETYPTHVLLNKGDFLRFTADVTSIGYQQPTNIEDLTNQNPPNNDVIWSVEGATSSITTITDDGLLTIGKDEKAEALTVIATAKEDSSKSGKSTVTVTKPREDGKISFGVITDAHVGGSYNLNTGNNQRLIQALKFFNDPALKTDRIVVTGDLSGNGYWPELQLFRHIRNLHLQRPLLATMGNHEECKWENFEHATGNKANDVQVVGGYYFITVSPGEGKLDERTMRSTDRKSDGYNYIRSWLESRISEAESASTDKPIFIFLHHPPILQQHDLYGFFNNHPRVIVFSGDTHDINNSPFSIRQDDRFTWVHASAICGEPQFEYTSQGLYVEADKKGNVTIKTRDFTNDRWLEDQIHEFNVNKPLPYTNAIREPQAQVPVFNSDAEIRMTSVNMYSVSIEFDCAVIPQPNRVGNIVLHYRYEVINQRTGERVKNLTELAKYYLYPAARVDTMELFGFRKATDYELRIYAVDAWGKESKNYISKTFTTAAVNNHQRNNKPYFPIDYILKFDGSLKNDGITPDSATMFFLENKPDVYDTIAHYHPGKHGQSIFLSKKNFVILDNKEPIDYEQSFTVAFWIKVNTVRNDGSPGILSNRNADSSATNKGYSFRTSNNQGTNYMVLEINPENDTLTKLWLTPTRLGEWVHVAATFNYDTDKVTTYINGRKIEEVKVDLSGGIGGITGIGRNKSTFFGSTPWAYTEEHGGYNGSGYNGRHDIDFFADDFVMTSNVLSEAQIQGLMDGAKNLTRYKTTVYPNRVRIDKGDFLRFTVEVPSSSSDSPVSNVIWNVVGATSKNTKISANGLLSIGKDENATILTIKATPSDGKPGFAKVAITTQLAN